ncbi:MAG: 1,6-anhydro-N-acetylmuramyl-L-alanine amidase AmpD [Pseudomonadota bacterium]
MTIDDQHRLSSALWRPSPHCDERPAWATIDLVVVHCVSLPEGQFGTGAPERLFLGQLDCDEHPSFTDLVGLEVSPHLFVRRDGDLEQFVRFDQRAWHAGTSTWRGRSRCNDFSIGIELEGCVGVAYAEAQYRTLRRVWHGLRARYPTLTGDAMVGHSEIAPGRKTDPGPTFVWSEILDAGPAQGF